MVTKIHLTVTPCWNTQFNDSEAWWCGYGVAYSLYSVFPVPLGQFHVSEANGRETSSLGVSDPKRFGRVE